MRAAICTLNGGPGHDYALDLLEKLYRIETGRAMPPILTTSRGKPYFADGEYHFSISHTRRHAFCVLARQNVGIDAEELDRPLHPPVIRRVLSESELRQYAASPDPRRTFLTFWVLKEAAAKLSGQGLQGFPNQTSFCASDPRVREWDGCLVAILAQDDQEEVITYAF